MRVHQAASVIGVAFVLLLAASSAHGIVIAEFDFESVAGSTVPKKSGVGADGILAPQNVAVVAGVLDLDNFDPALGDPMDVHGMSIPLELNNPFGGGADWRVKFDFSTEDVAASDNIGAFFSSDGGLLVDGEFNNDEQRGSLNIFMNSGGAVVVDAWWIGAIASQGDLNDGETHTVDVTYTAADSLWKLAVDGELAEEAEWAYTRAATADRVRVGGVSNPDFGFEIDGDANAFDVNIDNLLIEGTPAPDLNQDGEISILDWDLFVAEFGSDLTGLSELESFLKADLNANGGHDAGDFVIFSTAFDAANGAGAFAAMAVPEPDSIALLGFGVLALLSLRRAKLRRRLMAYAPLAFAAAVSVALVSSDAVAQTPLVEYLFDSGQTTGGELKSVDDTSGNNRHGTVDFGAPSLANGKLIIANPDLADLPISIPLGADNPFDGTKNFTIEMGFKAETHDADGAGHLLLSSADGNAPNEGLNHSMSLFIEPEGHVVYDNFFVGEVRAAVSANDGQDHTLKVLYFAPEDLGDPDDPNRGEMLIQFDGLFLGNQEIAPSIVGIEDHEVYIGGSLNEDFPYECEVNEDGEDECFVRPFQGEMDFLRIFDEAIRPTDIFAEVNRANGDIKVQGGELQRDVNYFEISSEGGAINSAAWAGVNLDQQNLDSVGEGSGDTWDVLTAGDDRVVEAFLKGSTLFGAETEVILAGTWGGGAEDLELQIVTTSNEILGVGITFVGEGNGNQGGGLDCNGDGAVNATDFDCSNTAGTTAQLIAQLGLIEGDLNGDGTVSFPDFLLLSTNFNQSAPYSGGDIDGDGIVGFPDFLVLSTNFNRSSGALASVPESVGSMMPWVAFVAFGLLRRRR